MRARGEDIALPCSTARNPKRSLRIQELLERHAATWLGPLAEITDPRRRLWARGFLDGCALARHDPPSTIDRALGHPAWRTVRVLETTSDAFGPLDIVRLICQPETAGLRSLYTPQLTLEIIATNPHAPQLLELAVAPSGIPTHSLFSHLHAACFARLRKLHLFGAVPAMLSNLTHTDELTLIVVAGPAALAGWREQLEERRSQLPEVRLVSSVFPFLERRGIELVLRSDEELHWNRLEVRWTADNEPRLRDQVLLHLGQLPAGAIQRLSFVGPPAARFDTARWQQRVTAAVPGAIVE